MARHRNRRDAGSGADRVGPIEVQRERQLALQDESDRFGQCSQVEVGEREAAVDLYIIVKYGVRIPDVALSVQENVKQAIESMTGLSVVEVNIHVQGVGFPDAEKREEEVRVR